ncbi:hypothetical protein B5G43_02920 [Flavonifractor sp. An92]|uniref:hypothetical protein n=1 Tax=Flavonifractor sp. An92 TaxID=1965666 RepID=UPI000B38A92A|nr:hypothetical protein [Flavonifractor sp. An92]OUN08348.1 hypothetical protein B5G43_02920 [Flavonifractor sp. An92]
MAKRVLTVQLNSKSISSALKEVRAYKAWVDRKTKELARKLARIGAAETRVRFAGAQYDGVKDASVSVERIQDGYKIVASGGSVFFLEFGAGVYYNGAEPYPEPRPAGVVGIGQYGKGKGKQKAWGFYDDRGELVVTHGTPAAMPMLHAGREMRQQIEQVAREVFAHD